MPPILTKRDCFSFLESGMSFILKYSPNFCINGDKKKVVANEIIKLANIISSVVNLKNMRICLGYYVNNKKF